MMQEASVQGFFRTILIILLVYYGLKIIGRFMAPIILKKAANKFEERVKKQQGKTDTTNEKVGETVIDKKPNSSKQSNDSVGEYVDFEEVDE